MSYIDRNISIKELQTILQKPPSYRSNEDVDHIANLMKNQKYFVKMHQNEEERLIFTKLCAKFVMRSLSGVSLLKYHQSKGDIGEEAFMIIQGEAHVYGRKSEEELEVERRFNSKRATIETYNKFIKECLKCGGENLPDIFGIEVLQTYSIDYKSEKGRRSNYAWVLSNLREYILGDHCKVWKGDPKLDLNLQEKLLILNHSSKYAYFERGVALFREINIIKEGDLFGELALIFKTARTASVIASQDTHLFVLDAKNYLEVFSSHNEIVKKRVDFIQKLFPSYHHTQVSKFCYMLEERVYNNNETIYKEGDIPNYFFIIKRGEVQISRKIKIIPDETGSQSRLMTKFEKRIIIVNLGEGNFFGEEEVIIKRKRKFAATSIKEGTTLFMIHRKVISRNDQDSKDWENIIEPYFTPIAQFIKAKAKSALLSKKKVIGKKHSESQEELRLKSEIRTIRFHNQIRDEALKALEKSFQEQENVIYHSPSHKSIKLAQTKDNLTIEEVLTSNNQETFSELKKLGKNKIKLSTILNQRREKKMLLGEMVEAEPPSNSIIVTQLSRSLRMAAEGRNVQHLFKKLSLRGRIPKTQEQVLVNAGERPMNFRFVNDMSNTSQGSNDKILSQLHSTSQNLKSMFTEKLPVLNLPKVRKNLNYIYSNTDRI